MKKNRKSDNDIKKNNDSTIKNNNNNLLNNIKKENLLENRTNQNSCSSCKLKDEEIRELNDILKSTSFIQTADKLNLIEFRIQKESQTEINEKFNICNKELIVKCHGYNKIVSITADTVKETNQPSNSTVSNEIQ